MSDYYWYDEEVPAGYQDADLEQAEYERVGNEIARARARGVCQHGSAVGYISPAIYPEQEGLKPGELRCTEGCGQVFSSEENWDNAREEARYG